jgi:hypothetical protein
MNPWRCPRKHFFCNSWNNCNPAEASYVCNGGNNCDNGRDEKYCDQSVRNAIFFYVFAFDVFTQSPCRCAKMDLNVGGSAHRKNSFAMANTIVLMAPRREL